MSPVSSTLNDRGAGSVVVVLVLLLAIVEAGGGGAGTARFETCWGGL